jgi:hypothetical protein
VLFPAERENSQTRLADESFPWTAGYPGLNSKAMYQNKWFLCDPEDKGLKTPRTNACVLLQGPNSTPTMCINSVVPATLNNIILTLEFNV